MEITAASSAAQVQAQVQAQLGVSVLRKSLDIEAQQGAQLAQMLAQVAGVGQRVDQNA